MIHVEVWSDINCPYCYIGKRHLEKAVTQSGAKVEIEWRSFELDPVSRPPKGSDQLELLAQKYGKTRDWALSMHQNLTDMAARAGLEFHLEKVVPANSFHAHRLIHFAKAKGKQDAMKERLLRAKFVEGKDIDDPDTLRSLAGEIGLLVPELFFDGKDFEQDVRSDEEMAGALGISGVPFFVFNKKFAVSGAQPVESFLQILKEF